MLIRGIGETLYGNSLNVEIKPVHHSFEKMSLAIPTAVPMVRS